MKKSLLKTRRLVVLEEHYLHGGLGQTILSAVQGVAGLQSDFVSIPDKTFVTGYGSYEDHCAHLGFTPQGIAGRVRKLLTKKRRSG